MTRFARHRLNRMDHDQLFGLSFRKAVGNSDSGPTDESRESARKVLRKLIEEGEISREWLVNSVINLRKAMEEVATNDTVIRQSKILTRLFELPRNRKWFGLEHLDSRHLVETKLSNRSIYEICDVFALFIIRKKLARDTPSGRATNCAPEVSSLSMVEFIQDIRSLNEEALFELLSDVSRNELHKEISSLRREDLVTFIYEAWARDIRFAHDE